MRSTEVNCVMTQRYKLLSYSRYGWNSVRKFGRLRGTYDELRATQSTCSIAFATFINIELCDTNLIHPSLFLKIFLGTSTKGGLR